MSGTDPKSDDDLRALARDARKGSLSRNDQFELDKAMRQSGSLSRELGRIVHGES